MLAFDSTDMAKAAFTDSLSIVLKSQASPIAAEARINFETQSVPYFPYSLV